MKKFKLNKVFSVNSSKKIYHASNHIIYDQRVEDSYPYIVRQESNNGLRGYLKEEPNNLNPGNTITFAQDTFVAHYQKEPYFTGNKVKVLKSRYDNFNANHALYIIVALSKYLAVYSWGTGSNVNQIENYPIMLPVNENDEIDWDYMEEHIQNYKEEYYDFLKNKLEAKNEELEKDIISSFVFERETKKFLLPEIFPEIKKGSRLTTHEQIPGDLYFVMSGVENQGISGRIGNDVEVFPSNSITVDILGNTYYRRYEYGLSDDVVAMWNNELNKYHMLYLTTAVAKTMKNRWDYGGNKFREDKADDVPISLPVNDENEPDYDYMQSFIIDMILKKNQSIIDIINESSIKNNELNVTKLNAD